MNQNKLPADPMSMILGILGIIIVLSGTCCYGIPAIISLILSIIALIYSNKSLNEYAANPEIYAPNSRSNVYIGKVLNIISIVLSSIWILVIIGVLIVYGTLFASIFSDIKNDLDTNWEDEDYYDENGYYYDDSQDSLFIEEENDSLYYYLDEIEDSLSE